MIEKAKQYYFDLYRKDYDFVRKVASSNFTFQDPTVTPEQELPSVITGIEDFIRYMDKQASAEFSFEIEVTDAFESNSQVILYVKSTITGPKQLFGGTCSELMSVKTKGITVIEVQNGKIEKHTDYFDYSALNQSIGEQLES